MFQDLINEALETGRPYIKEGEVATYIPELGRADKNKLGISIFCRDGSRFFRDFSGWRRSSGQSV